MNFAPSPLHRNSAFMSLTVGVLALACSLAGCKSQPQARTPAAPLAAPYPARPTTPPPPFHVFHQSPNTITLVTDQHATDDQIAAILWQLRDAAHAHAFDTLHIPQQLIDARDPIIWFHLYRGPQCASEKYTTAALPCGASYHAAGEYTLGGFTDHNHDDGAILHDENHETPLWNPDLPYTASAAPPKP